MKVGIMILSLFFLTGCASSLNNSQNINLVLSRCPTLKNYSQEKLKKVAIQIKDLPDDSELIEILNDYGKFREACRLANKKLKVTN